jgi:hypothetical protein
MPPAPPPPGGPPSHDRPGLPWERGKDFNSLLETAKLIITSPATAYDQAKEKGDYGSPILFAVVFAVIGGVFSAFWQILDFGGSGSLLKSIPNLPPEMRDALASSGGAGAAGAVFGIILAPIFAIIGLFIWSAIVHLVLQLIGALNDSTAGFEGTLRSAAYASVAQLAYIVPVVGPLAGFVWSVILQVLGLASLHRTTQGKALAGVLIPVAICCVCIIVGVMMFAGAIMAALGAAAAGAN